MRGQPLDERDVVQALVGRDALGHPGHQRVAVHVLARDHEGDRDLAAALIGAPDHGRLGHRGMAAQQRLELGRRHLQRVDLDDLLQPVDDEHVALGVHVAEVAAVHPAVRVDQVGRLAQVAAHGLRAADQQLALDHP